MDCQEKPAAKAALPVVTFRNAILTGTVPCLFLGIAELEAVVAVKAPLLAWTSLRAIHSAFASGLISLVGLLGMNAVPVWRLRNAQMAQLAVPSDSATAIAVESLARRAVRKAAHHLAVQTARRAIASDTATGENKWQGGLL